LAAQGAQVSALEESSPEGTLVMLELNLPEPIQPELLIELNTRLHAAGVPPWPGYTDIAFADATQPKVYVAWSKGGIWMLIIIGIVIMILPVLLGGLIWLLIPQQIKDLIMMAGIMMIMMFMMKTMTKEIGAKPAAKKTETRVAPKEIEAKAVTKEAKT
jgi:hypothetical protein